MWQLEARRYHTSGLLCALHTAERIEMRPCFGERDPFCFSAYQFQFPILETDMGIQCYFWFGA